ncbi:hypothetical protein BGZ79_007205, partial [Entomortierella chlamydospora]
AEASCGESLESTGQRAPFSLSYILTSDDIIVDADSGVFSPRIVPWIPLISMLVPVATLRIFGKIRQAKKSTCTSRCPFEYLKRRLAGQQNLESRDALPTCKSDAQQQRQQQQQQQEQRSQATPSRLNPKTIMLASLGFWMIAILLAPRASLNNPIPYKIVSLDITDTSSSHVSSDYANSNPKTVCPKWNSDCTGDFSTGLYHESANNDDDLPSMIEQEDVEDMVRAAEDDLVMDSEWVMPEQDQYQQHQGDREEEEEGEKDQPSALRDFWYDDEAREGEEMQEGRPNSLTKNQARGQGCGRYPYDSEDGPTFYVFEYVRFWTEAMLFCLSLAFGGMISGLGLIRSQSRTIASKLQKQVDNDDDDDNCKDAWRSSKIRALANIVPFAVSFWAISHRHFSIPAAYFACLGIALMALTSSWIPESLDSFLMSRQVEQTSPTACFITIPTTDKSDANLEP